jgi:type VI secretion system secreted protein Hcp
MAVDIFMKLGDIKGESQDEKHKEEIDVLAWSWGMSNAGSAHVGGGAGTGKVNVQDLSITKYIDKASPNLSMACATGKHFPKALLTVRKAGETPLEYVKLEMEDIVVTSVTTGGSGGEDRLSENVTLNFAKFKQIYAEQAKAGGKANEVEFAYDMKKNVKL